MEIACPQTRHPRACRTHPGPAGYYWQRALAALSAVALDAAEMSLLALSPGGNREADHAAAAAAS